MKCSAESALSYPHHRQLVSYLSESVAAIEAARSVLGGSWDQLDKTRRLNLVLKQGHQLLKSLASVRETTTPIVPLSPKSKSEDVHDGVNPRVALAAAAAGSLPIEILLRIMSFQSPSTTATISSSSLSSFEIYRQHQCDLAASFSLVNFKWAVAARSLLFTAPHLSSFSECLLFSQGIRLMKKYSVQRNIPDWQIQKTIKSFQFSPCSTLSPTRSSLGDEEEDSNSYFLQTLNSYASNLVCLDIRDLGNFTVTAKTLNSIFSSHPHITRFSVWRLDVDGEPQISKIILTCIISATLPSQL